MMKSRMVLVAAVLSAAVVACQPPAPPEQKSARVIVRPAAPATAVAASAPATMPAAPKPIVLSKPAVLGAVGPSIVVLPANVPEPEIRVRLTDESPAPPVIGRKEYRGRIETLRLANGKYVAINVLPLESYIQGVLAKELLGSWQPAAFRAQAIAARTFALYEMATDGRSKDWDVNDDESSQVYGGIAAETAKARAAVADTRGQVLMATVDGKAGIFCSRFSSCIGGASQDPFDAWGDSTVGPLAAHLTGDVDSNSSRFNWDREFVVSKSDLLRCIQNWGARNNFPYLQALARIEAVVISKRNAQTHRPTELLLSDNAGRAAPIRAEEFRLALLNDPLNKAPKPYSSNFEIRAQGEAFVLYNGHGFGHGIGLSQWGAQNMALKGATHGQILAFFYPGASLKRLW
jgi:stage II sporulation protein D